MKTLLILEDNAATRRIIRRTMEPHGYVVVESAKAIQAIELAQQSDLDLVISAADPYWCGVVIEQLRICRPDLQILMTHNEPVSARVRALLTSAAATLQKPLFPSHLVAAIAVLENREEVNAC